MISYSIDKNLKIKKIEDILELPQIVLVNDFSESSAKSFRDDFNKALNTGQEIIPIVIDSYGGQVYSLLSMVGLIKSSPVPVATIVTGKAMSCGAVLLSCGTEGYRFMDKNATVMIHEVSSHAWGKIQELKVDVKEADRLNDYIIKLMAKNIGKPEKYFIDIIHEKNHADWYLTAQECRDHNLVNELRVPKFSIEVKSSIKFV